MVYVVMPPELSARAIQTLIQYMYSGEATVSIDILSEVLQGGEMLKIRGLWHNNRTDEPSACSTPQYMAAVSSQPVDCTTNTSRSSSVASSVQQQQQQPNGQLYERRTERLTNAANMPVLKERPLNLMSPPHQPLQKPIIQPSIHHHSPHSSGGLHMSASSGGLAHLPPNGHIVVKKEMAIDPGEVPTAHFSHSSSAQSHHIRTPASKKVHHHTSEKRTKVIIHENGRGSAVNDHLVVSQAMISQRRASSPARYSRMFDEDQRPPREIDPMDVVRTATNLHRLSTEDGLRHGDHLRSVRHHSNEKSMSSASYASSKHTDNHGPDPMNFLTIKQEPTEWPDYDVELEKTHIEVSVKPELVYGDRGSDDEGTFALAIDK